MVRAEPGVVRPEDEAARAGLEASRLAAAERYGVLDTAPEPSFDRIAALAAELLQAPVAIIGFIGRDRVFFKSHHGLTESEASRGTDPSRSALEPWIREVTVRLLADARCTLFPIRWNEPFGLVILESLACGTPVLAFDEGASAEIIEHGKTGFICEDESDMAEAIHAAADLDRQDCRAATETYFSMDRCVAEHLELFRELTGRT